MKNEIKKLTLIEALCIRNSGWTTDRQEKLFKEACAFINQEALIMHLENEKQCIQQELDELKKGGNK